MRFKMPIELHREIAHLPDDIAEAEIGRLVELPGGEITVYVRQPQIGSEIERPGILDGIGFLRFCIVDARDHYQCGRKGQGFEIMEKASFYGHERSL
jgi:hypothetical protein